MSCAFINIRLAMASTITCALALFIPFTGHAQSPAKLDKVVIAGWGKPITEITNLLVEEDKGFFKAKGIEMAFVTLHVGAGTFQPVRVESVDEHIMHSEYIEVSDEVVAAIAKTKARGGRVIAVGTTSVRSLESAAKQSQGTLSSYFGDTDIFIYPGYQFQVIDAMITNFHLPESTLIMLVSAFAGQKNIMNAYNVAIAEQYRFFSYGDAMFLTRHTQSES